MEILDVVDDKNNVIGEATEADVYAKQLHHRIVHVMIFNDRGEMFLQQRSAKKNFCPGHWVTSAGGHVLKGESMMVGANRELKEELGIDGKLNPVIDYVYDLKGMKKFTTIFTMHHNGPFNQNPEEVAGGRFFSVNEVRDMVKKNELIHPELAVVIGKMYP